MLRAMNGVSEVSKVKDECSCQLTSCGGAAKVHTDCRLHTTLEAIDVASIEDTITHGLEYAGKVGAAEVCPRLELGQRIHVRADAVKYNILGCVYVEFLRKEGMYLKELNPVAARNAGSL